MPSSWRHSPAWLLVVIVAATFAVGVIVPLEIASYTAGHQKAPVDESLESSFRIAYVGQWSGFDNHWYNYSVMYAASGMNWSDLWMTVYFNGTNTQIISELAHSVVNDGAVASFNFLTGLWKGGAALVQAGQTLSVDTGEFDCDGNTLFVAAIQGNYYGTFSMVIP